MMSAKCEHVPVGVDGITPQWLTAAMRRQSTGRGGPEVTAVRAEQFAQDTGFASRLYRLHLTGRGVPPTVVAKLPAKPEVREAIGMLGGYEREVRFYRQLAGRVPLSAPRAHAVESASDGSDTFVLVLEDLTDWENGDHLAGLSLERVRLCLAELGALHCWSAAEANSAVPLLFPSIDGTVARDLFVPMFEAGWKVYRDRTDTAVPPPVAKYAEHFASHAANALAVMAEQSVLLHGDMRADNLFFRGDRVKAVDFQFMAHGAGAVDVAYLVSQSLPTEDRRGSDETLVRGYLDHVASHGSLDYRFDDAWRQYRAATAYWIVIPTILLIGWDTMPERSRALCLALVDRAVAAIDDTAAYEVVV